MQDAFKLSGITARSDVCLEVEVGIGQYCKKYCKTSCF